MLRPRDERPRDYDPRKKFDEFPSRHGFTRAKELIGYNRVIRFWIEKLCPSSHTKRAFGMSALPPKADIGTQSRDVRFVPKADVPVDGGLVE